MDAAPVNSKNPRQILLALCDNFLLSHLLRIAALGCKQDLVLMLSARTWRAAVESRYSGKHFQQAQWADLSFVRTVCCSLLKDSPPTLHR